MAKATMILHCGAREVDEHTLSTIPTPEATRTWGPVAHYAVLNRVKETLIESGYAIRNQRLALSRNDGRFFAALDLEARLADNVLLAIAVRSSIDKSLPLGLVGGQRVMICDNLCLRGDLINVRRKHSTEGMQRFTNEIVNAVARLSDFQKTEAERIRVMQETELTEERANSLILTAFEKGIVSARYLPRIVQEWRHPSFAEFKGKTLFNLLQSFTTVLGERIKTAPDAYTVQTIKLNNHLLQWRESPSEPNNSLAV